VGLLKNIEEERNDGNKEISKEIIVLAFVGSFEEKM
jgi:hypothetical protein